MKRNKSGISLIVLIITIIVIIILASVAIVALQDSDIITFAQNSKTEYYKGTEKEKTVLDSLSDLINETIPEDKEEQGTTQKSEDFLKTRLLACNGDAAIDEYGNIVDLSSWNILISNNVSCTTFPIEEADENTHMIYAVRTSIQW